MRPTGVEREVCRDIARRQELGLAKYGVSVADNPLSLLRWLQHAYEETLDKAVYLRRAMREVARWVPRTQAKRARLATSTPTGATKRKKSGKATRRRRA